MTYVPDRSPIVNITNAVPAVVTTGVDHGLTTGQVVRIHVPRNYGMYELNQLALSISVLSSTTFSLQYRQIPNDVNVNSTNYNAFVIPNNPQFTAEVLAIGSGPTKALGPAWLQNNAVAITTLDDATTNIDLVEIPYGLK